MDAFLGRSRSFRADAVECIRLHNTPPKIFQRQHIPGSGPCLVVTNHYNRPGFDAWWIALGISAVVPVEIHWMMTSGWTHLGVLEPLTRWLFPHLAQTYGFTATPPMPPKPDETAERARAVQQVLRVARQPGTVIGLAPEGRDHPDGVLQLPPSGSGRFIWQLSKHCRTIVPVGIFEDEGGLCLNFGDGFKLDMPPELSTRERDSWISRRVMRAIACQLPKRLRGIYA